MQRILVALLLLLAGMVRLRNVSYDGRALLIDGQRKLLISGSVHYPRSTPGMWPSLTKLVKDAGLDVLDTYAFWNGHEPIQGQFDFTERYDIVRFIKEAQKAGLYVLLRIGPYVCAEWDFGGFPGWLKLKKGVAFRTYNSQFMAEMKLWTEKLVKMMKENGLMYPQGGPIIALQIENEYGAFESQYGEAGKKYVKWAAEMANNTNAGVPWIMCYQDDAPAYIINTCNGFYCDNWIAQHHEKYPNQPAWFTENWPGWFQTWGGAKPIRPAEDVAFSVLRWYARGGTLMNYYMFHGGSNFGRTAGGAITTTYDYDAPIDEYGLPNNPKYAHLQKMHKAIHQFDALILGQETPKPVSLGANVEAHIYGDIKGENCVAFISNINEKTDASVSFNGGNYKVPAWSVSILKGGKAVIYNSATIVSGYSKYSMHPLSLPAARDTQLGWFPETICAATPPVYFRTPREQLSLTKDLTDYLWYSTIYTSDESKMCVLELSNASDVLHIFLNETYQGDGKKLGLWLVRGKNRIQVLATAMGLSNYGMHMEKIVQGLNGDIRLCGRSIRENTWQHVPGLVGEAKKYFDPAVAETLDWHANISEAINRPLTWILKKLNVEADNNNLLALDLRGMGKGYVWVNGHNIGRYYKTPSKGGCKYCDYRGPYNAEKCCVSNGYLTQEFYHVPRDWVKAGENVVILFEETGGDPRKVEFVKRELDSVCSSVYEHYPENDSYLTVACGEGRKISSVDFASFGTPVGECGNFRIGECHAEKSLQVVKAECSGKAECRVRVSTDVFGDPCSGYTKLLSVQARCTLARTEQKTD